jgi:outer membrane biosynthesis protein TonB
MDRAEATGLGVALAGHGLLLAILSLGFATATTRKPILSEPVEVSFVEEVAPQSTAPSPSDAEPATRLAEIEGPVEDAPPPPQVEPAPVPAPPTPKPVVNRPQPPAPAPTPKPVAQRPQPAKPAPPQAKPAPAEPAPAAARPAAAKSAPAAPATPAARPGARPTGRLSGLLTGISDRETESRATTPPAKVAGPAVQASLAAEIRRQLKPHWKAPTGADVELLRTQVTVTLASNGSVASIGDVQTTGETPSNRSQVKLHQEQAVRAVRLAAPFNLPADFYDAWKVIRPTFDRRLSQ